MWSCRNTFKLYFNFFPSPLCHTVIVVVRILVEYDNCDLISFPWFHIEKSSTSFSKKRSGGSGCGGGSFSPLWDTAPQNERKRAFSSWDLFQISLNMHSLSPLNNCRSGSQSLQHISTLLILASEL